MKHTQKGLTLLEVLVALAIISVALTAIFYALYTTNRSITYLQDKTFGYWIAENQLAAFQLNNPDATALPPEAEGHVALFNEKWHWHIQTQPTSNSGISALIVDVTVNNEKNAIAHLRGYLGAPRED